MLGRHNCKALNEMRINIFHPNLHELPRVGFQYRTKAIKKTIDSEQKRSVENNSDNLFSSNTW